MKKIYFVSVRAPKKDISKYDDDDLEDAGLEELFLVNASSEIEARKIARNHSKFKTVRSLAYVHTYPISDIDMDIIKKELGTYKVKKISNITYEKIIEPRLIKHLYGYKAMKMQK